MLLQSTGKLVDSKEYPFPALSWATAAVADMSWRQSLMVLNSGFVSRKEHVPKTSLRVQVLSSLVVWTTAFLEVASFFNCSLKPLFGFGALDCPPLTKSVSLSLSQPSSSGLCLTSFSPELADILLAAMSFWGMNEGMGRLGDSSLDLWCGRTGTW